MPPTSLPAEHTGAAPDSSADASSGVAVLDRAFAILHAFGQTDDRLSLAELSRRTGLYKSTILRLLAALEHGGFMRKLDDGQYAVGHEPLRLAALYQRSFRVGPVVEPLLETLSRELGETASFYVRHGEMRSVLYRVEPTRTVRVSIRVGEEFPVHQGASGKVLLAFTDPHDARWNDVREQLWAASYGERDPETASASVPVFGAAGDCVGALTVSGPKSRLAAAPAMAAALAMLLPLAQKATVALGGAGARYDAQAVRDSLARFTAAADDTAQS